MTHVSILMSAYNAEDFIGDAVSSILEQTLQDWELLIMDDGSTDGTYAILKRFDDPRIKVFSQENSGKASAINALLDRAQGKYVTIQDADDASPPERLDVLSAKLDAEPDLGMLQSGYALILNGKVCAPRRSMLSRAECQDCINRYRMPGLDPTLMVRTEIAKEFKLDSTFSVGQTFDFILRVGERYPMEVIPAVLYHYRFHYASITKSKTEQRLSALLKAGNNARRRRGEALLDKETFYARARKYFEDEDNNLSGHFVDSAFWSVESGNRKEARQTAFIALKNASLKKKDYLKPLVYAFMPRIINHLIRKKGKAS